MAGKKGDKKEVKVEAQPESARKKILMIDDDQFISELFRLGLESAGFDIMVAHDGIVGIELAEKRAPDVILLDLLMPVMDGFETLIRLKNNPKTSKIPVFMLSTMTHGEDMARAKALGAVNYFVKTQVTPTQLAEDLKRLLKIK